MQELVRGKGVAVDHPLGIGQVLPERFGAGTVYVLRLDEMPIILIQQEEVSDKLDSRDNVALPSPGLPVQKLFRPLRGGRADRSGLRYCWRFWPGSGGRLILCESGTRCSKCDGTGKEHPKKRTVMLESAHPRRVAGPALGDRACLDYWMPPTN